MDVTYKDLGLFEKRCYGVGGPPEDWACETVFNPVYDGASRVMSYVDTDNRTLSKGDKEHALPFTGSYREFPKIMSGRFRTEVFHTSGVSEHDRLMCGDKAGITILREQDIGLYVRNNADIGPPAPDLDLQSFLRQSAETSALADLRRSYNNVPLLFAERYETLGLIKSKGSQLVSLARAKQSESLRKWIRTRKRDRRLVAKDIASEHLAFLFGVLPLVNEIDGLMSLLAEKKTVKLTGRGARAQDQSDFTVVAERPPGINTSGSPAYNGSIETRTRYSHRVSLQVNLDLESGAFKWARDLGFSPLNAMFDLVPLSFVANFVSNVQSFVKSYDPLLGVSLSTGSSTSWLETIEIVRVTGATHRFSYPWGVSSLTTSTGDGESRSRALAVERSVLTDYPPATLLWQNNLSLGKVATGAALALQRTIKPLRFLLDKKQFRYRGPRPKYLPPINYR